MSIKASEISDLIKARIEKFQSSTEARNVGTVVSVTDGIVRIHGLADAPCSELAKVSGLGGTNGEANPVDQEFKSGNAMVIMAWGRSDSRLARLRTVNLTR